MGALEQQFLLPAKGHWKISSSIYIDLFIMASPLVGPRRSLLATGSFLLEVGQRVRST